MLVVTLKFSVVWALMIYASQFFFQGVSHLSHQMSHPTTTTPEPIYQNAAVVAGHFHCQMQSTVTCSTPPACSTGASACFVAPEESGTPSRKQLPNSAKEWVSFEFNVGEKSSESVSESKPNARKKDPFANDPFFSKTPGSEEIGEVVIWSQVETHAKATSADVSRDTRVEPIYGFFVEPDTFADFSGFKDESAASNAAWIPMQTGVGPDLEDNAAHEGALDATGPTIEASSDRESSSDAVSFPSPDAPPPPLPQNTPVLLDYQAPVPPPRPGSSCARSDPSATQEHSIDRWVDSIPPALPSRPSTLDNPLVRASEIPPPPPPRSDLATLLPTPGDVNLRRIYAEVSPSPRKTNAPRVDHTHDPFAVAISKRSTKPDTAVSPMPAPAPIQSTSKYTSKGLQEFHDPSPIPPRKANILEDSTTTLCDENDHSFSPSATSRNGTGEFHDPFSALDPFTAKDFRSDPFASICDVPSLGSTTSDPFGKRFSADSQSLNNQGATTTDSISDAFDDVFSSRDESDEKTENSSRSPASLGSNGHHKNGGREKEMTEHNRDKGLGSFNTTGCNAKVILSTTTAVSYGSTDIYSANFPGSCAVEFSGQCAVDSFECHAKSNFNPQSSFDSVMDDFARRFPPFDDNWATLAAENYAGQSAQSQDANPADSLQPVGGTTAGKSRVSIPKSSDSSSNSEIAEAFGDDGNFSSIRSVKQQMKS